MSKGIRCHCRRRTLRRFPDGNAAGTKGVSRSRRRPRDLPERHGVHPHRASAGDRRAVAMGAARPSDGDELPADRHLCLRLRPLHDRRRARHRGCAGRVLPAADGSRQAAGRCRGRGRCRGARALHRRGDLVEDGRAVGIKGRTKQGAVVERAAVVVGADGRNSIVAETVRPEQYDEKPPLLAAYYTYWSGLPMDGRFESYIRDKRGFAAAPTHDGLTMVIAGWPYAEFAENKKDIEGNYLKTIATGAGVRRSRARREAGGGLRRRCRAELFPQALWSRLGARG